MKIVDLLIGFLIGIAAASLGIYLFIELFTDYSVTEGLGFLKEQGMIGKVITLGSILNLIAFFILLQLKKEMMARGVILATFALAILTVIL